jgi:DNA-binding transcriptional ArsR family regulator
MKHYSYIEVMKRSSVSQSRVLRAEGFLKLISDRGRATILLLLSKYPNGLYVHEFADFLHASHSATSHQLGKLEARGLIVREREGQMVRYLLSAGKEAERAVQILKNAAL